LPISVFFDFPAIFTAFPGIKVTFTHESLQNLWSICKNVKNNIEKVNLGHFAVFSHQNVDLSHFMRQQTIALIFLPVIEDIKVYHLGYPKVFAA
jgi:hypothetical protein